MSRSTTTIAITREAQISSILMSFSAHFIILFSKFSDSLDIVHIIYYSPTDIGYSRVTKNLCIISKGIRNESIRHGGVPTIWHFVRLYSPVLDSHVLSGYLSLNTKTKTFIQILIYQFRHYPVSQSSNFASHLYTRSSFNHGSISRSISISISSEENNNFIIGMTLTLKGRIQTESIKPRKTVQSFMVGSHYSTQPVKPIGMGRHYMMSNSSITTNSNYELGSYSISVKVTGKA